MYYCQYAHFLKKRTEHTCMSTIYYDQERKIKANQCKTIVTFDNTPESEILDASNRVGAPIPKLHQYQNSQGFSFILMVGKFFQPNAAIYNFA